MATKLFIVIATAAQLDLPGLVVELGKDIEACVVALFGIGRIRGAGGAGAIIQSITLPISPASESPALVQFQAVDPVHVVLAGISPVIGLIATTGVLIVVSILFGEGTTQLAQIAIIVIARTQLIALVFSPGLVAPMGGRPPPGGSCRRTVVLGDIAEPAGRTE